MLTSGRIYQNLLRIQLGIYRIVNFASTVFNFKDLLYFFWKLVSALVASQQYDVTWVFSSFRWAWYNTKIENNTSHKVSTWELWRLHYNILGKLCIINLLIAFMLQLLSGCYDDNVLGWQAHNDSNTVILSAAESGHCITMRSTSSHRQPGLYPTFILPNSFSLPAQPVLISSYPVYHHTNNPMINLTNVGFWSSSPLINVVHGLLEKPPEIFSHCSKG